MNNKKKLTNEIQTNFKRITKSPIILANEIHKICCHHFDNCKDLDKCNDICTCPLNEYKQISNVSCIIGFEEWLNKEVEYENE